MMPFSVLRIWGTGLLSWAILAGGVYCLWEWSQRREPEELRPRVAGADAPASVPGGFNDVPLSNDDVPAGGSDERIVAEGERAIVRRPIGEDGWEYLAAGTALLLLSGIGFLPVVLLLGNPGLATPKAEQGGEVETIDRPDGTRLHVEIYGARNRPTVVFTHGWSLDRTSWYYLKHELADRFRVVVWDLPGLGRSQGPRDGNYELEKMADDLAAVLSRTGRAPVVLVGHSIGGMIVQTFCRLYSQQLGSQVAGIVLLQTTYTNPLKTAWGAPFWRAIEKPILTPLNYLTIWLAPLAWLSNWQSYLNGSLHIMTRLASFSGRQTWGQLNYGAYLAAKAWPGVVARGNLAMVRFDEEAALPDINIPTLVIAGQNDRMTKPDASTRIEQLIKSSLPFRVKAGHLGLWEANGDVAAAIGEFAAKFAQEDRAMAEIGQHEAFASRQPDLRR